MPQLKIGIALASLRQPFKNALLTAKRLGADAVEIDARGEIGPNDLSDTALRHVRKMLDDLNLRVSAVSFTTRRGYNVLAELDRRLEATQQAMRMAYDLGSRVLVNHVGRVPDESSGPEWDLLVQSLTDLGRCGQRVGAFLAARTGSEDASRLKALIDALPAGSLGIDLDPGNMIVNGFSPRDVVDQLGEHVMHVHARDGVRDLAQGRGLEVQLGRGSADFPELLGALEEHDYRGYFTIQRDQATNPELEIGQSVQYLRNL